MANAATKSKAKKNIEVVPPSPIWVRWIDSMEHTGGWDSAQAYADMATYDMMVHETVGFLIGENAHSILITGSIQAASDDVKEPNVGTVMQIPKVALVERKDLTVPATKAKRTATTRRKTTRARPTRRVTRLRPVATAVSPFNSDSTRLPEMKTKKRRAASSRSR